ncbi:tRNA (adenosine(37)-N6)-threonylcarbamoyltransferase complex ATPase subunit type 1 TsaE [Mangrovimonas aestuarii]|uniref:tRNA (adenosine(37)-N6)-threonylcarbamoyltransferase complex ATPase subunit type 1 TsaE n=1 Tax=Mangrovimonas aestuarii TaxID=3018443 RepID=UPI002378D26D|nr:tRNA (adenosine(37)-N6)-threonylcarbamoyltransferase complex ATPase subunit type 1 TsaE [Mangrovimonas aestuarii]
MKYTLKEIDKAVKYILDNAKSKTLLFYGDMGVGKTTLIKALVKALGSNDEVTSPTFSIVNEYIGKRGAIFHFDFYRIEDEEEAYNFGIEDYLSSDGWLLMEWPKKIENLLPLGADEITISLDNDGNRLLEFNTKIIDNNQ